MRGYWLACFALLGILSLTAEGHERRIDHWLVVGPFPNDDRAGFNKDYLNGEGQVAPAIGDQVDGKTWMPMDDRVYCRNQDDYIDLSTWFMPRREGAPAGGNEQVLAYAHVYIWSPAEQQVYLWVGASDGFKAWLNGEPVAELAPDDRQPIRDEHDYPVTLDAGWNRLLVKSANDYRIWGFYAKLGDAAGKPLDGLEYSVDAPEGPLAVTTAQLPAGYTGWPYLWLTVEGVRPLHSVPSASPFRFEAKGGTPPYRWAITAGQLPAGLLFDEDEGEILGTCPEEEGVSRLTFQVTDAAGATASAPLTLTIAVRPTKWYEDGKIGGLIHGSSLAKRPYGDPQQQAASLAREGYTWAAQTTGYYPDPTTWPGWYHPAYKKELKGFAFQRNDDYMEAFRAKGVGFASYLGLPDAKTYVYPNVNSTTDTVYPHWARYNDAMQQYFEEWFAYARPVVIYLDGAGFAAPNHRLDAYDPQNLGYDFDPVYSMGKTVSPETLIIANSCGNPGLDWRLGDCDVFSTEGMNDGYNPVWDRWPIGQSEFYPKRIPNESWRYPFTHEKWGDHIKNWQDWTQSVVTLICEGHLVNLDHSVSEGREELHDKIGAWLEPRLESLKGTRPGPVVGATWGYSVQKDDVIYFHVLANRRGKIGLPSGATELIAPPLENNVNAVRLFPEGKQLEFRQDDGGLRIDVAGAKFDPVDTIFLLEIEE